MNIQKPTTRALPSRRYLLAAVLLLMAVVAVAGMAALASAIGADASVVAYAGTGTSGAASAVPVSTSTATFSGPVGDAVDAAGNLFIAEHDNFDVREITPGGTVIRFVGNGTNAHADGASQTASFRQPTDVAIDSAGTLYVCDDGAVNVGTGGGIRKVTTDGAVSTVAGSPASNTAAGSTNSTGTLARFNQPYALCIDAAGLNLYVADMGNNKIRKVEIATGRVTTYAGTGTAGHTNGATSTAQFNLPSGIAIDATGTVYVSDRGSNRIRKISVDGVVSDYAGTGVSGHADGTTSTATFSTPYGLEVGPDGSVYVAEGASTTGVGGNDIRVITPDGAVTRVAGSASGVQGSVDATGTNARFSDPRGICMDAAGDIFIGDHGNTGVTNPKVREIPNNAGFTIVSSAGSNGTISPLGTESFKPGDDATFSVVPDLHYHIEDVLVDGSSIGASSSVTFAGISADHTISATFAIDTFTISYDVGAGGTLGQAAGPGNGYYQEDYGYELTIPITPDPGFHIASVLVDGGSIGASSSVTFSDISANHTIAATFALDAPLKDVIRLGGTTRYATAAVIALDAFPGWAGVHDVVLASGDTAHQPDALTAAGLAGAYNGPLLLVPTNYLDPDTRAAIAAMPKGVRVHLVGSSAAISTKVKNLIAGIRTVKSIDRFSGPDRYATGAAVARKMISLLGSPHVALITNGASNSLLLDPLVASTVSVAKHFPVLLVKATQVPSVTAKALKDLRLSKRYIVGNSGAVSEGVRTSLGVASGDRIFGTDVRGDAVAFAQRAHAENWLTGSTVGFAAAVPDAATGGAYMGRKGGPVLLVFPDSVPPTTSNYLTPNKASISGGYVFGDSLAVNESVRAALKGLIN